jgi:hypothetical protein
MRFEQPVYEPTPEEIADVCAQIQRGWSPDERRRRSWGLIDGRHAKGRPPSAGWRPPLIIVDVDLSAAVNVA